MRCVNIQKEIVEKLLQKDIGFAEDAVDQFVTAPLICLCDRFHYSANG